MHFFTKVIKIQVFASHLSIIKACFDIVKVLLIFEKNQVLVPERHEPLVSRKRPQSDVSGAVASEAQRFQRGLAVLIDRFVALFVGVELVDDIDGLRGHSQLCHETVVCDNLLLMEACSGDKIVELDSEHYFSLGAQFSAEL